MKHLPIYITIALLAVACGSTSPNDIGQDKPVKYVIDGNDYIGNSSDGFIYRMLDMAYSGHSVTFGSEKSQYVGSIAKYTFSTANREDAFRWAKRMSNNGFTIQVTYSKKDGKYHCIATR